MKNTIRLGTALVLSSFLASHAAAASIVYRGAETSNTIPTFTVSDPWGTTTTTGYKGDYRSTSGDAKQFVLPGNINAYGTDGYLMFDVDDSPLHDGSTFSPATSGTQSGNNYNNVSSDISQVGILGTQGNNFEEFRYSDSGSWLDDPRAGISTTVADILYGCLFYKWSDTGGELSHDLLQITMGAAADKVVRIGVLLDRGDNQKPTALQLGPTSATTTGFNNYILTDWYFFDVYYWDPGETFNLAISRSASLPGQTAILGLVVDSYIPEPTSLAAVGIGAVLAIRRRPRR